MWFDANKMRHSLRNDKNVSFYNKYIYMYDIQGYLLNTYILGGLYYYHNKQPLLFRDFLSNNTFAKINFTVFVVTLFRSALGSSKFKRAFVLPMALSPVSPFGMDLVITIYW